MTSITTSSRPGARLSAGSERRRLARPLVLALASALVLAGACAALTRRMADDRRRDYLGANGWPVHGQAAYRLGTAAPVVSPRQRPTAIASLAKVMTAYVVLRRLPLPRVGDGPAITVTAADVADYERRRDHDESVVPVRAGERLRERQALQALLLPSANNVAPLLARLAAGTTTAFVREMNRTARALGMRHTRYTDPSGYAASTVSTAQDQLTLAEAATRDETLSLLVADSSARLPVVGTVRNTNSLLNTDGFVGTKTGSDDSAGGCFMFQSWRVVRRQVVDMVGVVLGQQGRHPLTAGLYGAKQLVDHVAPKAAGA